MAKRMVAPCCARQAPRPALQDVGSDIASRFSTRKSHKTRTELLRPEIDPVDTGATSVRAIPDHVDLVARTARSTSLSVRVLAGAARTEKH